MRKLPHLLSLTLLTGALALSACKSELDDKSAAAVSDAPAAAPKAQDQAAAARTLTLDTAASGIEFVGAKVTADHRGRFDAPTGELELDAEGQVIAMKIVVDTTSVDIQPDKLEEHLRSPDFFDVQAHPQARFELTRVEAKRAGDATHEITGTLELRGVTKQIRFPAKAEIGSDRVTASASFKINRKDFGIVYAGMADDLIKDEVLLEMKLDFKPSPDSKN